MPSTDGSEPSLADRVREIVDRQRGVFNRLAVGPRAGLTPEECDRIAEGEPYCFRCGKPASSFPEYDYSVREGFEVDGADRADYVRSEEGTYNPDTNRFACDECYIALGMPSGPNGWRAP